MDKVSNKKLENKKVNNKKLIFDAISLDLKKKPTKRILPDMEFDVHSINETTEGVDVFVRAYDKEKAQIGFGDDGSIDIERFRVINPRVMVPDPLGDIIVINKDDEIGETEHRFRLDPKEALLQTVEHALKVRGGLKLKSKNIEINKVGNTTTTIYTGGTSSPITGRIRKSVTSAGTTWADVHDGTTGDYATTGNVLFATRDVAGDSGFQINRCYSAFTTSSIGSDTITSAVVSFYVWGVYSNPSPSNMTAHLVQSTASTSSVSTSDYNNIGAVDNPTIGAPASSGSEWATASEWVDFTLNSTGRGWIDGDGTTQFGVREGTYDATDTQPADGGNFQAGYIVAGGTNDPKIVIVHSGGAVATTDAFFNYI